MERFSCHSVVVGAGVIGLAVGRELALAGYEPLILERNTAIGMETSSRNSEVIHAGIYYPPGTLKARLCREGRDLLYAYCASRSVTAQKLGKLIVACAPGQEPDLQAIKDKADANGVADLHWLSPREGEALEPEVRCTAALYSPSTGILDSHAFMLAMLADFEAAGGTIAFGCEAIGGVARADGRLEVRVRSGATEQILTARSVVNCAGLFGERLGRAFQGLSPDHVPRVRLAKGNYARLIGASPFRHLVYPVPEPGGLGVHVTLDIAGQARLGPDVEWLNTTDPGSIDYGVPDAVASRLAGRVQAYWPGADARRFAPDFAGVRPKLSGPSGSFADFRIDGPATHGIGGLINLFGIESPGLTASLAIAREVLSFIRT